MEDVLEVYCRAYDASSPLVCLDEASRQLLVETRKAIPVEPGKPRRVDAEYRRCGTASVFMLNAPLERYLTTKYSWLTQEPIPGYPDGMNSYQYARSWPVDHTDPQGLKCGSDACSWGQTKDIDIVSIRFRPAKRQMSPGAIKNAESGVKWAQRIATVSQVGQVVASASISANKAILAITDVIDTKRLRNYGYVGAILDATKKFDNALMRREGVVIWVHVKYKFCEWDRCLCTWWGYNDWHGKEFWHRCSAQGKNALLIDEYGTSALLDRVTKKSVSAGFKSDNMKGIISAIPGCIREAIEAIGK